MSVPSNPEDRKKIQSAVVELSNSMTMAKAQSDLQKEIVNRVFKETGFDKKRLRRLARDHNKQSFQETLSEHEEYEVAYELLMKPQEDAQDAQD
jgi:hypothetical protein